MKTNVVGLTVAEAARSIGCSKSWVYSLIERGRIRVLSRGQPRASGRFVGAGLILDSEDVQREKESRA